MSDVLDYVSVRNGLGLYGQKIYVNLYKPRNHLLRCSSFKMARHSLSLFRFDYGNEIKVYKESRS